jgi:hypothetical protein
MPVSKNSILNDAYSAVYQILADQNNLSGVKGLIL